MRVGVTGVDTSPPLVSWGPKTYDVPASLCSVFPRHETFLGRDSDWVARPVPGLPLRPGTLRPEGEDCDDDDGPGGEVGEEDWSPYTSLYTLVDSRPLFSWRECSLTSTLRELSLTGSHTCVFSVQCTSPPSEPSLPLYPGPGRPFRVPGVPVDPRGGRRSRVWEEWGVGDGVVSGFGSVSCSWRRRTVVVPLSPVPDVWSLLCLGRSTRPSYRCPYRNLSSRRKIPASE